MSLTFDTGLSRSMRELIVCAISNALADLKRSSTPSKYLAKIVPLPTISGGKGDTDFLDDFARAADGAVPSIGIATGNSRTTSESEDALEIQEAIEVGVYVVSGNQRGTVDGRMFVDAAAAGDDTKDPGVFAIMQHVTERLQGASLGIAGVHEPRKSGDESLWSGDDVTIWGLTFTVKVDLEINPDRNVTAVMTSIEAKHRGTGIPTGSSLDPLVDTITNLNEE